MFGTQLCESSVNKPHEIEEILQELDKKAHDAMIDPKNIKKSPFLATIDLVLQELNERQAKGQLGKFYSQAQKNRIAMKFVDLFDRVKRNQRMAMQD